MVSEENHLRLACMDAVADDAPWAAYSDWLRERGRDREADMLTGARLMLRTWPALSLELAEDAIAAGRFTLAESFNH